MLPGVKAYRNNTGAKGRVRFGLGKGGPDIVACIHGQFVAFEAKVKGEKPRPDQLLWAEEFRLAGGRYYLIYEPDEAYTLGTELIIAA